MSSRVGLQPKLIKTLAPTSWKPLHRLRTCNHIILVVLISHRSGPLPLPIFYLYSTRIKFVKIPKHCEVTNCVFVYLVSERILLLILILSRNKLNSGNSQLPFYLSTPSQFYRVSVTQLDLRF